MQFLDKVLNGTLDSNRTINRYDKLNQKTKAIRKQCWKRLLCSLFLGSFLTIFFEPLLPQ